MAGDSTSMARGPFLRVVFRSCVGWLAARSAMVVRQRRQELWDSHVDATEGGVSFDISLAVEVGSSLSGVQESEPTGELSPLPMAAA